MMPLLDKLLPSRKSFIKKSAESSVVSAVGVTEDDRIPSLCVDDTQVRILLFRECEWRGRKLLFDSMMLEKRRRKNEASSSNRLSEDNNVAPKNEAPASAGNTRNVEKEKTSEEDISLLSEMVFGTVAMTYRGSSFKVHSMDSPPCIMCTKVFPATEHSSTHREKHSDEALGPFAHIDSNSSNSSARTLCSQPSSGNLSGNDLSPGPRKSSTCSSNGSGWDIDIQPPLGSSQSLESCGSSSGVGSLSSLRRRWLRAVSTSLSRSDSDDAFGIQHWAENGGDRDGITRRHKTRLGLTMLIRLPRGHESKIETRLLEHVALLEGMMDRVRFFCIDSNSTGSRNNYKGMPLADRIYIASSRLIVSLLRLLVHANNLRTPLLWHDVLLNSAITINEKAGALHRGLQQMCQLLEDVDTKSTNFFLSTVVTAVLTYHLGWVYTVLPSRDRQMMEKIGRWYPCNPLWAQLGDLYGALGNPVKVAHTVIAGDPRKVELINSILSFVSYFIRSGIVQKQKEYRCSAQEDVQEAISVLEQARLKRPSLFIRSKQAATSSDRGNPMFRRESRTLPSQKQISPQMRLPIGAGNYDNDTLQPTCPKYPTEQSTELTVSSLKRVSTMKSDLDVHMSKRAMPKSNAKLESKNIFDQHSPEEKSVPSEHLENNCPASNVKIIVSEISSQELSDAPKDYVQYSQIPFPSFEKKLTSDCIHDTFSSRKPDGANPHLPEVKPDEPKPYISRPGLQSVDTNGRNKDTQVFFTLGDEEKSGRSLTRPRVGYNCQCSYMFTRVPSTSAELPEGVLRKIIQRNFPESSKSIQPPPGTTSDVGSKPLGFCLKCNGQGYVNSQSFEGTKELLETPTNATEVLRTCRGADSDRPVGLSRSNSLEALMEANGIVELPMPRSKKDVSRKFNSSEEIGFTKTLVQSKTSSNDDISSTKKLDIGNYTWGLVLQGLTKRKKKRRKKKRDPDSDDVESNEIEGDNDWWCSIREEVLASARFPTIDQPVTEALCILADLDTWHVGILSNNTPSQSPPLPVGMSRLVSNMLESFAYVWRKYRSPTHCVGILESKLREMWLRSEALAEMLMATELCDASVANLTDALDVDAADIPLLLAVATTHSPEIAQRFGLTLA